MPTYSLDLDGPDGKKWVPAHDFPERMKSGDRFTYDGWTWQVLEVAVSQHDNDPDVLRCVPV
jgi:hypothetical protein